MSEIKQIGWIVASDGEITKYEPKKVCAPATRGERHAQFRIGLSRVLDLLTRAGFRCNAFEQSTVAVSVQKGPLMFDVSIKEPGQIAYVTSHVGYDPKKKNAKVISAADVMGCDYVMQIVGSRENGSSTPPVYVPLPKGLIDPADYVTLNVVRVMQTMVGSSAELKGIDLSHLSDQSQDSLDSGSPSF